jgi:hydrogenase maturation protease
MPAVLVIGLGNVLEGNNAFGTHVLRRLQAFYEFDSRVSLLDARTGGLELMTHIAGADSLIVVNTVVADGDAGELRLFPHRRSCCCCSSGASRRRMSC